MKVEIKRSEVMKGMSCSSEVSIKGDLESVFTVLRELGYSSPPSKERYHYIPNYGEGAGARCGKCGISLKRVLLYSCPESNCPCGLGA